MSEVLSEYIVDIDTTMARTIRPMGNWHSWPFHQDGHSPPEGPVFCTCTCVSGCFLLFGGTATQLPNKPH